MKLRPLCHAGQLATAIATLFTTQAVQAASDTWDGGGSGFGWVTAGNWGTAAPGLTGEGIGFANNDVATFDAAITKGASIATALVIDANRHIGGITFSLASGTYFIGSTAGSPLNLNSSGSIQVLSDFSSSGKTLNVRAPLVIEGASATYRFSNDSDPGNAILNISGAVSGGTAGNTVLTLSGVNAGGNTFSGVISNGTSTTFGVIKSGVGTWNLSGSNTFTGQLKIEEGILQVGALTNAANAGPLGQSSNAVVMGKGEGVTGTLEYTGGTISIDKSFILATGTTTHGIGAFAVNTSNAVLTLEGLIDGLGSLQKMGAGTLELSSSNTYSGYTKITAGTLTAAWPEDPGTNGPLGKSTSAGSIIFNGGTLRYMEFVNDYDYSNRMTTDLSNPYSIDTAGTPVLFASGLLESGTSGLTKIGQGALTLNAASTYTGLTTVSDGQLVLGTDNAIKSGNAVMVNEVTLNKTATLDLNGKAQTIGGAGLKLGGYTVTSRAVVVGAVDSVLTLSGGSTAVEFMADNDPLGSVISVPTLHLNNAAQTFTVGNSATAVDDLTVSSVIQNGALTKAGDGRMTLTGTSTYTGTTTISGGVLQLGDGTTVGKLDPGSAIVNDGNLTFNHSDTITAGADFNSVISGNGSVTQAGAGTTVLIGSNTYIGATTISAGILQLGDGATTGKLSTSSSIINNANLTIDRSNPTLQGTDFKGGISGTGSVTITGGTGGTGITTLDGGNTYQGGTAVSGGTLNLTNTTGGSATGTGLVTIANGATLTGTGVIGGSLTVAGTHSPGNSPGVTTVAGDVTYNSTTIFNWELTANTTTQGTAPAYTYDQVLMTGTNKTLTIDSGAKIRLIFNLGTVDFANTGFWNTTQTWNIISGYSNFSGSNFIIDSIGKDSLNQDSANYPIGYPAGQFSMNGGTLTWSAVPEPTGLVAGLLLGAGLLRRRR